MANIKNMTYAEIEQYVSELESKLEKFNTKVDSFNCFLECESEFVNRMYERSGCDSKSNDGGAWTEFRIIKDAYDRRFG